MKTNWGVTQLRLKDSIFSETWEGLITKLSPHLEHQVWFGSQLVMKQQVTMQIDLPLRSKLDESL